MPDEEKIRKLLKTRQLGKAITCLETVESTNGCLKKPGMDFQDGSVVIADEQTKGRGTKGRIWSSGKKDSLLMSVLLRPGDTAKAPVIALLCGLAVARALNLLCGGEFFIKWPNDIVCKGKKICGILCEGRLIGPDMTVVCGMGINLTQDEEFFYKSGLKSAASVRMQTGKTLGCEETAAAVLNEMEKIYFEYKVKGPDAFLSEYRSLCATLGRRARTVYEGKNVEGLAAGIGPGGELILSISGKEIAVSSGEVSVAGIMD